MSEKKISWADIADEEDARKEVASPPLQKWIPPHARQEKQKLKNLFSKEKTAK
jgi:hypothetical protein